VLKKNGNVYTYQLSTPNLVLAPLIDFQLEYPVFTEAPHLPPSVCSLGQGLDAYVGLQPMAWFVSFWRAGPCVLSFLTFFNNLLTSRRFPFFSWFLRSIKRILLGAISTGRILKIKPLTT
jgi:hypothetical protein